MVPTIAVNLAAKSRMLHRVRTNSPIQTILMAFQKKSSMEVRTGRMSFSPL